MLGSDQLISVINSENFEKLSELLEKMDLDEINCYGEKGETALSFACRGGYNKAVDLLVAKNGIDVNVKNNYGNTPLHIAICYNNAHAASKILTNPQADVNIQDASGRTPLNMACYCASRWNVPEQLQIVSELLARPEVDVNARDRFGLTVVMWLARRCDEEALKLLLEDSRVDLDAKDEDGRSLEVQVGYCDGSNKRDSRRKKCLEIINNKRKKRENRKMEQEQPSPDGNMGQRIEKIEKLNKEMGDLEKKWKENLDSRRQKRRELNERQSSEKKMLAKKYKEDEATLKKKHEEEETMLESTCAREDQVEQRHIAILRERRDELAQELQKLTIDPVQDYSEDHNKVEAAQRSLECPVCFELMRPPTRIWMCPLSHIICEPCKDGLDKKEENTGKCPTCMTVRVTTRAWMAENFARTIFNE